MDSLCSILFFLFTFFSFYPVSSFASQPSYKEHCDSIVQESTPNEHTLNSFPLGDHHTGYYKGGDSIIDVGASWNSFSFKLSQRNTHATQIPNVFKVEGTISFRSTNAFRNGDGSYYYQGHYGFRGGYLAFKLDGFWSESSGKVCMVGTSHGYSRKGNSLNVNAVFKLYNVFNASNITSLVSGSLESLSSEEDENYFKSISLLMFPKANYEYTLDSVEADNEFPFRSDAKHALALNLDSLSFCKHPLSWMTSGLQLEYSPECNSFKNCSPIGESGSSSKLPPLMSLKGIECSLTKKHRLRVLVEFSPIGYYLVNQGFDPKTMLVGEGLWNEKNNMLRVVACHMMGKASSSLVDTHIDDCSIRLRLIFPSIWSIKNTSTIVGQIWSNKRANDPGYFKVITFRNDNEHGVGGQGLKYEYSQLEKVNQSCPTNNKPIDHEKIYPDAFSYNMRFDMSVRESKKKVAWGYSYPLAVDDQFYEPDTSYSDSFSSYSTEIPDRIINNNNNSLFNISYKISISVQSYSKLSDKRSLFNLSSERVKISAEGTYDAGAGTLCMIGCRDLNNGTPKAHSVDCEILLKFQFPSLDTNDGSLIKGSIKSLRDKNSDPLYFKPLELSAVAYYRESARRNVWRMDMEVVMALTSTTLACVFVGLQLYYVKSNQMCYPLSHLL
ncbi:hypothetical protein RJT34_29189 [Clitoria ternatea]|uniref:DUF2921 domain-containing protein n=1 Tax=Clitoria ternatea TaxID=43366 RepID=A0AAN9FFZ6_CLITE